MKKSTWLPLLLLAYLAFMGWIGRGELLAGRYAYYFGIISFTLICIIALHFFLRKRERLARERRDDIERSDNSGRSGS